MSSTKIIHVLKNDEFDEVFDLFKNIEASEVIFILPKGSKIAKLSQHFTAIKREADSSGKQVSIMTADPIAVLFASQNNIELLRTPESKTRLAGTTVSDGASESTFAPVNNPALEGWPTEDYEHAEPKIRLTATIREDHRTKIVKDIVRPKRNTEHPVKIREEKTKSFEVEIAREVQEKKISGDITQVWAERERDIRQMFKPAQGIKKIRLSKIFRRTPLFFAGGAVIVLFLILYTTLGSAQITIKPQKQELNFQIKASASSVATAINLDFNKIPGQRFSYKNEEFGVFPATGQKEVVQKASGEITIYNKSGAAQRLVATTRFKSPDGLIFRIPETINVPAATGSGTTLKEGSIKSLVYADKAGAGYNIEPATFTIPGLEGSPKFDNFYAKSSQPMSGGIIGLSKVVTEEDFTKARETATTKLKEKILESLRSQAGELKILDSIEIKFESPSVNAKVGEAAETLRLIIKGTATTMAFRESDILELIKNYISQKDNLELLEKNLTISYLRPQNSADNSAMAFDIRVTGQAVVKIDQDKILKDTVGMKREAVRAYFTGIKEIESARITLSPFWVKSIPKDLSRVKLIIEKE